MRRSSSQGAVLALAAKTTEAMRTATGQWGPCADVSQSPKQEAALAVVVKARGVMKVRHVLVDPREEITQKTVQAMEIATTGQRGPCEARLQVKAKRQAVQCIDGPDKTSSNGFGDEDLGVKPVEDGSVGRRGTLQLEVQELELEQQPASQERRKEIQEAPPDPEEGTREAPPDPAEDTQEAPPDFAEETQEAPSGSQGEKSHRIPRRRHGGCHWTP